MRQRDPRQPTDMPGEVDDQPKATDRHRPRGGASEPGGATERGGAPPTKPAQPSGTEPLERDYWPQNQRR